MSEKLATGIAVTEAPEQVITNVNSLEAANNTATEQAEISPTGTMLKNAAARVDRFLVRNNQARDAAFNRASTSVETAKENTKGFLRGIGAAAIRKVNSVKSTITDKVNDVARGVYLTKESVELGVESRRARVSEALANITVGRQQNRDVARAERNVDNEQANVAALEAQIKQLQEQVKAAKSGLKTGKESLNSAEKTRAEIVAARDNRIQEANARKASIEARMRANEAERAARASRKNSTEMVPNLSVA